MRGMELSSPPPDPPDDTASGAAREWLKRERRRAEPTRSFYGAASGAAADKRAHIGASSTKAKTWSPHWKVWAAIVLTQQLLLTQFVNRGMALAIGLVALALYHYARRVYGAYRLRQSANQAAASRGGTSDD